MPRTIEIREEEVRVWTCPKCGGHVDSYPTQEVIHCGFGIHDDVDKSGCGSEFPESDYESQSVVTGTQYDLLGTVYDLLIEEAKKYGHECIVFGALPGNVMTFTSGSVDEMDGVPFIWVRTGKKECSVCGAYGFTQRPDGCTACKGPV